MKEYVLCTFCGEHQLYSTTEELTQPIRDEICDLVCNFREAIETKEGLDTFDIEIMNSSALTYVEACSYIFLRLLCRVTGLSFCREKLSLQCWPV